MHLPPRLRRALVFATVAGLFGAALWSAIGVFTSQVDELLAIAGGTGLFWAFIGFLLGILDPTWRSGTGPRSNSAPTEPRKSLVGFIGTFIYRTVIGVLAGCLVCMVIEALGFALIAVVFGDITRPGTSFHGPIALIMICSQAAGMAGAPACGLLFTWFWAVDDIPTAIYASAHGAAAGMIVGTIPPAFANDAEAVIASAIAGAVAGILASLVVHFWLLPKSR